MVPKVDAHVRALSAHVRAKRSLFALQNAPWAHGGHGLCARARFNFACTRARRHMVPTVSAHMRASSAHVRAKRPQFALQNALWAHGAHGLCARARSNCARARARKHMVPTASAHVRAKRSHTALQHAPWAHGAHSLCARARLNCARARALSTWCPQLVRTCALQVRTCALSTHNLHYRMSRGHMVPTVCAHARAPVSTWFPQLVRTCAS